MIRLLQQKQFNSFQMLNHLDGDAEKIELLIKAGANVNCVDPMEMTPLHRAVQKGILCDFIFCRFIRRLAKIQDYNEFLL